MKPKGMLNQQEKRLWRGIGNAMLFSVPLWIGIWLLIYISQNKVIPVDTDIVKIIIPYDYLNAGWRFNDPADDMIINDLVQQGKAQTIDLPDQVEITHYAENETPTITKKTLRMWRKL